MSKDIAYQVLIEDADRRYRRWYLALQAWTIAIIPVSWLLAYVKPPTWVATTFVAWMFGVAVLQKRWRNAAKRSERLRDEKLSQLVAEVAKENERLWRMLRDE